MQSDQHYSTVPKTTETQRDVASMIAFLSVFAALAVIFFAIRNLYYTDDPDWLGLNLIVVAVLLLGNVVVYLLSQHLEALRWTFILVIAYLLTFVTLSGMEHGSGILWLYAFPPMVFYVSSLRIGGTICVLAMALVAVILLTPLGTQYTRVADYSQTFSMVLLVSLGMVMLFSFVLDRSRRQHAERLHQMAEIFEYAAKHDALTGLYNRREATQRLAGEYSRYQRNNDSTFSLILIDIDHFKRINDTFGHDVGDEVIRTVASRLLAGCRQMDMVARWGGEEFLLMLPDASRDDAVATAERIRQHMADTPVEANGRPLEVTCSFGVAEIQPKDAIQTLLKRTDEHLYAAKTSGRNRIVSQRFP